MTVVTLWIEVVVWWLEDLPVVVVNAVLVFVDKMSSSLSPSLDMVSVQ